MPSKTSIMVIGMGTVGNAVYDALDAHYYNSEWNIGFHDLDIGSDNFDSRADGIIVCVPESQVWGVVDEWNVRGCKNILIKSTMPYDLAIKIKNKFPQVSMSPEFLSGSTNAHPVQQFLCQEFMVIGGHNPRFWANVFKPALTNLKTIRYVSYEQACFIKLAENAFLASKVTFFNQLHEIYQSVNGQDFDVMIDALSLDPRIGHSHTGVPGPDGEFGFGGHCLPKDLEMLCDLGKQQDCDVDFLRSIQKYNKRIRK